MNKFQAEKIIKNYGGIVATKPSNGIIRRKSFLPYSKPKIKQAFFIYIAAIIDNLTHLPKDIDDNLVTLYSILNSFVDDKVADELVEIEKLVKEKKLNPKKTSDKKRLDKYFDYAKKLRDGELFDEINEYIEECYKSKDIKY